jgi:hypothetical protein
MVGRELPGYPFIDALEALIAAAANGTLAKAIHARQPAGQGLSTAVPGLVEVAALTPGTVGDIRIAGLGNRLSVNVRYAEMMPWEDGKKPSERELVAWQAKGRKGPPRPDLEQYRRVSAETIYRLSEALAPDMEEEKE